MHLLFLYLQMLFSFIINLFSKIDTWYLQVCKKITMHQIVNIKYTTIKGKLQQSFLQIIIYPHKCKRKARLHLKINELTLESEKMLNSLKNRLKPSKKNQNLVSEVHWSLKR